jgi:hypothetical protein
MNHIYRTKGNPRIQKQSSHTTFRPINCFINVYHSGTRSLTSGHRIRERARIFGGWIAKYQIPEVSRGEGQLLYVGHPRPGPTQAVHSGLHGRQLVSRHQNNHLKTIYDKKKVLKSVSCLKFLKLHIFYFAS